MLYAADRARKLRARARQMSAMNERLDVAAAKVDEQQERKQARVRASAELTSVLPAIKRPPLTLPGAPAPAAEPGDEPVAAKPEAVPGAPTGDSPAGDSPETADEVPSGPVRTPEGTLTMDRVIPEATPAPNPQEPSDGTLIMPSVPGQGPGPAGGGAPPLASSPARPRTSQPRTSQNKASQPRTSQSKADQPRTSQPCIRQADQPTASQLAARQASQPRAKQPRAKQPRAQQPRTKQQSTSREQANRD